MSTTMQVPQHMSALQRANQVRGRRAELKQRIRQGEKSIASILNPAAEIPSCLLSMTVTDLLRAQRRWGRTRARKLLNRLEISEVCPVGNLTPRQRRRIVEALSHGIRDVG